MDVTKIGVIGAGQMGNGIAHVMALAGYQVCLNDISKDVLSQAITRIDKNMTRQVKSGKIADADKAAALSRITTTLSIADIGQSDLVIEAATEDEPTKQVIFDALVPHIQDHTILTSNTSSISITRLASRTGRPEKFMGFHFMNPVPVMQLVELIRGIATDKETYDTCRTVVENLGKTPASANDNSIVLFHPLLQSMSSFVASSRFEHDMLIIDCLYLNE